MREPTLEEAIGTCHEARLRDKPLQLAQDVESAKVLPQRTALAEKGCISPAAERVAHADVGTAESRIVRHGALATSDEAIEPVAQVHVLMMLACDPQMTPHIEAPAMAKLNLPRRRTFVQAGEGMGKARRTGTLEVYQSTRLCFPCCLRAGELLLHPCHHRDFRSACKVRSRELR
jgi:hypothetical protein